VGVCFEFFSCFNSFLFWIALIKNKKYYLNIFLNKKNIEKKLLQQFEKVSEYPSTVLPRTDYFEHVILTKCGIN